MKISSNPAMIVLSIVLSSFVVLGVSAPAVLAQTQESIAVQRGYRTGYSDGYMAGYRDTIDSMARSYVRHNDYSKANRAFNKEYGLVDDYRDGYQQGFEAGYDTGYERRSFEATLPAGLKKRGVINSGDQVTSTNPTGNMQSPGNGNGENVKIEYIAGNATDSAATPANYQTDSNAVIVIPCDTELILELQTDINTQQSREGEKFTAKIISPSEIAGATIEGRVAKIRQPGRIKRRSELLLSFDRIILSDNRWSNFSGTLIEIMAVKGDNVKRVDNEGTALGQSSLKGDMVKVGGSTGAGALIGGVVGGPVGVAVGAGVGAAFGVGAVVIERGKHIRLNRNQQIRIKAAHETQIR